VIAAAIPRAGVGHKLPLMFSERTPTKVAALYANLSSLVLDFIARQKVGGTSLTYFILKQLTVLPPSSYTDRDLAFIVPRVLELTYTAWDMRPFAKDLATRASRSAGTRSGGRCCAPSSTPTTPTSTACPRRSCATSSTPKDVMGEDYPSETFRVLKEREIREYGEYRTQRLVLEAYDRFATNGTFDPARLEDPEYFPVVRAALAVSKGREQDLERTLKELVDRTDQTPLPTLFVEGATDKLIIEGAWQALYPGEPLPVTVLGAGGTMQMRSLAAPGTAIGSCSAIASCSSCRQRWPRPRACAAEAAARRWRVAGAGEWHVLVPARPDRGIPGGHGAV